MQIPSASRLADRGVSSPRASRPETQVTASYAHYTTIAGPLMTPASTDTRVRFRHVIAGRERWVLSALVTLNMLAALIFLGWLLSPGHLPAASNPYGTFGVVLGLLGFASIIVLEIVRLSQSGVLALFASRMRDPVPMVPESGLRVAVLTTIVPSKEPVDLVARTLRAMRELHYDGTVDVWILDEGDDPTVRAVAQQLGVRHFSRHGRPEYNQPSGPFRAKSKAGNHNAWRAEHEHEYDIVAQMDPDHVPTPDFLERTLGYFRDRDVAFVVAPQVYGNLDASFVARGAADQSYLFHGVIQRGGNGLNAPLLIGTNHLYRTSALHQIGGYQDSVIEDHLTSLTLHATPNPETGNQWKGIYTPDILAIGEGPAGWTDYFNQQQRWAYGIWDIIRKQSPRLLRHLTWSQRLAYMGAQSFYPSVAVVWTLGNLLTAMYLTLGITAIALDRSQWLLLWTPTVVLQFCLFLWLRRFNLAPHERRISGALSGLLLSLATGPIYVAAAASALVGKPLTYVVTAKSSLASSDSLRTFRLHGTWIVTMIAGLVVSVVGHHGHAPLRAWAFFTLVAAAFPIAQFVTVHHSRLLPSLPRLQPARFATLATSLLLPLLVVFSVSTGFAQVRPYIPGLPTEVALDSSSSSSSSGSAQRIPADVATSVPMETASATSTELTEESRATPQPTLRLPGEAGATVQYGIFSESGISAAGDINHVYYQWTEPASAFAGFVDYSASSGRIALISWEPRHGLILPEPDPADSALLQEIADGEHDAHIQSVAAALNGTGQPVIIRFAFEMDLEATGLHPWAGQDPVLYRQAYRHVVDLFRQTGATQVRWLWSPSAMTDTDGDLIAMPYYPGGAYVDYVGFSAFLYWQWEEWSPSRQLTHAYRAPYEYFSRPIAQLGALGKPIIIPELGVDLHPSKHAERGAWIEQAAHQIVTGAFPGVVAVVYFDTRHNWDGNEADWRLSPSELLQFTEPFSTSTTSRPSPSGDGRD